MMQAKMLMPTALPRRLRAQQQGVALFVVIVFVMLSMLLALWASRTSMFNELVVGNDADYQRAFEAAQTLLQDAELDIRGENPDGTFCTGTKCRNNISGAPKIPLEGQDVTPLLAMLNSKETKCSYGLCAKRAGRQDFWNYTASTSPAPTDLKPGEVTLEKMTGVDDAGVNVGARYGDFTGATVGEKGTANPILADGREPSDPKKGGWYWIEILRYDESSKNDGLIVRSSASANNLLSLNLTPNVVYRVTAIAYGRKPGTMAVLQQTYARQMRKD